MVHISQEGSVHITCVYLYKGCSYCVLGILFKLYFKLTVHGGFMSFNIYFKFQNVAWVRPVATGMVASGARLERLGFKVFFKKLMNGKSANVSIAWLITGYYQVTYRMFVRYFKNFPQYQISSASVLRFSSKT